MNKKNKNEHIKPEYPLKKKNKFKYMNYPNIKSVAGTIYRKTNAK